MPTSAQIRDALKVLRPDDPWAIAGTEITMLSGVAPTEAELQAEIDRQLAGPTLSDHKEVRIAEINDAYSEAASPLIKGYPEIETKTWPQQDSEARAYLGWHASGEQGDPPITPVLDRILAGRNGNDGSETLYQLCQAVKVNAEMFTAAQEMTGLRQRLVKQIRAAETVEEVLAVVWPVGEDSADD